MAGMDERLDAWSELVAALGPGEVVEAIVFGNWGGRESDGYGAPAEPFVPLDKRGIILTADEAQQYMHGWAFDGGYGSPDCYAVTIWTNLRIGWVTQYDGSTRLDFAPRNPTAWTPEMPGG